MMRKICGVGVSVMCGVGMLGVVWGQSAFVPDGGSCTTNQNCTSQFCWIVPPSNAGTCVSKSEYDCKESGGSWDTSKSLIGACSCPAGSSYVGVFGGCVENNCNSANDCKYDPLKPICLQSSNTCVECEDNSDCGSRSNGETQCNLNSHECQTPEVRDDAASVGDTCDGNPSKCSNFTTCLFEGHNLTKACCLSFPDSPMCVSCVSYADWQQCDNLNALATIQEEEDGDPSTDSEESTATDTVPDRVKNNKCTKCLGGGANYQIASSDCKYPFSGGRTNYPPFEISRCADIEETTTTGAACSTGALTDAQITSGTKCCEGYKKMHKEPSGYECKACGSGGVCCGIELNTVVPFIGDCIQFQKASNDPNTTVVGPTTAFPVLMKGMSRLLVTAILIFSFLLLVVAGVMMTMGGASEQAYSQGTGLIKKVIIGIALLGASGVILKLINPNFFG